jgi:GxxExxY protein
MNLDEINKITEKVIGCAIEVHRNLGPGLLESAYQECLKYELKLNNIKFESEVPISINYKGLKIGFAFRADFIIEDKIIIELKAVEDIHPVHSAQLLTYLKLTGKKIGLIINFNVEVLKNGIKRRAN